MSEKDRSPLWGGRFGTTPAEAFERLNASIPFDARLAPYDIRGSIAHARMLGERGIISGEEARELERGLLTVLEEVEAGRFSWTLSDEDVHTAVERRLRETAGDVALKLHTGRSRNDQVALDLHLFVRDAAGRMGEALVDVMRGLVEVAEKNRSLILPGYTHLQRAQPILLSHHLLAHFRAFERDLARLEAAREAASVSPLGAAALGGTPHPVEPGITARELGMEPLFLLVALRYLRRQSHELANERGTRVSELRAGAFVRVVAVLVGFANMLYIGDPLNVVGAPAGRPLTTLIGMLLLSVPVGLVASGIVLRRGKSALAGNFLARYGVAVLGLCLGGAILGGSSWVLSVILNYEPGALQGPESGLFFTLWATLAYGSIAAVVGGVLGLLEGLVLGLPLAFVFGRLRNPPQRPAHGASFPDTA